MKERMSVSVGTSPRSSPVRLGEASADGLLQALAKVLDSRDPRGVRYRLATLLAIGACDDGSHGRRWDAFATVDPGALTAEGFARLTALASPAVGPLSSDGVPEREQRRAHRAAALAPDFRLRRRAFALLWRHGEP